MIQKQLRYYIDSLNLVKGLSFFLTISVLFDTIFYLQGEDSKITYFRGFIFYAYTLYIVLNHNNLIKLTSNNNIIIVLILYWALLIPFSSEILRSVNIYSRIIVSLVVFILTSNLAPNKKYFKYLFISFSSVVIISVLFGIISNIFGVGDDSYTRHADQYIGVGLGDGKLYSQAVAIGIFPYIWFNFKLTNSQKKFFFLIIIIAIIYSIISVRRTTLIIITLSSFLFFLYSNKLNNLFKYIPLLTITILLSSYFWYPILKSRMELREAKFSSDYNIEEEARYKEVPFVIDEILLSSDLKLMLFGKELFNSNGNYADGLFGDRRLHVDYIGILHGSGVIGLTLYFLVYLFIFKRFRFLYRKNRTLSKDEKATYKGLFYSFLITSLIISLSGQMYEITFRTMIFFTLGIILSNLNNESYDNRR